MKGWIQERRALDQAEERDKEEEKEWEGHWMEVMCCPILSPLSVDSGQNLLIDFYSDSNNDNHGKLHDNHLLATADIQGSDIGPSMRHGVICQCLHSSIESQDMPLRGGNKRPFPFGSLLHGIWAVVFVTSQAAH